MTRATPQVTLRPLDPADFPRVAEMYNMFYPNPITPENLQRFKELIQSEALLL